MFAQLPFVFQSRTVRGAAAAARLSRLWQPPQSDAGSPGGQAAQAASQPVVHDEPAHPPPYQRTRLWRVAVGLAALSAIVTAAVLLMTGEQRPEPAPPLPLAAHGAASSTPGPATTSTPTQRARLVVSVVGKVAEPGLVTVDADARVADALEAAGGTTRGANLATINLARKLSDGEQIYVDVPVPPAMATDAASAAAPDATAQLDLNEATAEQLQDLPGVGEVTAQRIIEWRTENSEFTAVEQLREVSGIGETRLADLRDRVTVTAAG